MVYFLWDLRSACQHTFFSGFPRFPVARFYQKVYLMAANLQTSNLRVQLQENKKKEIKVHFKYLYWHRLNRLLEKKLPPRASFCHHSSATRPSVCATLIKRQTSRVYHLKHTNSLLLCVSLTFWLMAHICKLSMHSTKRAKNKETRIN